MMSRKSRWLAATALVAGGGTAVATVAVADEGRLQPHQGPVVEIGLEGSYLFNESNERFSPDPGDAKFGYLPAAKSDGEGASFGINLRYNFDSNWAVEGAFSTTWLDESSSAAQPPYPMAHAKAVIDSDFTTLDLSAIYRLGGSRLTDTRIDLHFGVRGLLVSNEMDVDYVDGSVSDSLEYRSDGWYVGPRLGIGAGVPLTDSLSLVGGAFGSVLFGEVDRQSNDGGPAPLAKSNSGNTVYNLEGSLGLNLRLFDNVSLQAGYRAQKFWDAGTRFDETDKSGNYEASDADLLVHGPYVRLNFAF